MREFEEDPGGGTDEWFERAERADAAPRDQRANSRRPSFSRRDFLVSGSTLAATSVAAYLIGGRPASAEHGHCPPPTGPPTSRPPTTNPPGTVIVTNPPPTSPADPTTTSTVPADAEAWSSRFGAEEGDVRITSAVVLDIDARVRSLVIEQGGTLVMSPGSSRSLTSAGNVVVQGELVMEPASADVVHRVHFDSVDESRFRGGGMEVLESDVGLWVQNHGRITASGTAKTPWTRATADIAKGATRLRVADTVGWRVGDRVAITPTIAPTPDDGRFHQDADNAQAYDEATITAISGDEITVDAAMVHPHPVMHLTQWDGAPRQYGAEVLNLTRNVIVSGTDEGRAHVIFVHCHHPQNLSGVHFDRLGPRRSIGSGKTDGVEGRYPFHMHHCGDGSRGSVIRNCLVTRSGNRAFVPHASHGVTLDGCVAHDVKRTAFWWDNINTKSDAGPNRANETHDATWTRCVASKVWATQRDPHYRMAGFALGGGNDDTNSVVDSVAVGVYAEKTSGNTSARSGFFWGSGGHSTWKFDNNLAHNIAGNGAFSWQNSEDQHVITNFTAYHCAGHGVEQGAYSNYYHYDGLTLVANRWSGIAIHAVTRRTGSVRRRFNGQELPNLTFRNVAIDGRGLTVDGVRGLRHRFSASEDGPTLVENVTIEGCTRSGFTEVTGGRQHQYYRFRNWQVTGSDPIVLPDGVPSGTTIEVDNVNGRSEVITR